MDLPGLILHDNEQGGFKSEVEDLVRSYCGRPNVICLVVSNSDMDLQMNVGYALVKDIDKLASSIFILTKPDMLVTQGIYTVYKYIKL